MSAPTDKDMLAGIKALRDQDERAWMPPLLTTEEQR